MSGNERAVPFEPRPQAAARRAPPERWFAAPILWLGAAILAALIAACAATVLLSLDHDDPPLPIRGEQLLNVPAGEPPLSGRRTP